MLKIEETNAIRQKSNAADNQRDTSLTHLFIVLPFLLQNLLEQRLCLLILWEKQTFSVNISRSCEFPYIQFKSSKTFEIKRNQTFMFKTRTLELIKKKLDRRQDWLDRSETSHAVLGLAWRGLTLPTTALIVLRFLFLHRTVWVTHQCFGHCWAVLAQQPGCLHPQDQ